MQQTKCALKFTQEYHLSKKKKMKKKQGLTHVSNFSTVTQLVNQQYRTYMSSTYMEPLYKSKFLLVAKLN